MKANVAVSYSSFLLAFAYFIMFNIFDLSSTILALKLGLSEANFALVFLSNSLGIDLADVIMLVKSAFFVCVGGLMMLGIASKNQGTKKVVYATILVFSAVFALVSLNNFLSIYSALTLS